MTDSPSPSAIVRTFMGHIAVKDYDSALPYVADDCDYHNMPMVKVTGPAGVRAVLEPFFAPTIENEFRILRSVEQGSLVFTERLDRHLIASGWVELPVTGVFEVVGGQITLWHEYFDLATIMTKWPTA